MFSFKKFLFERDNSIAGVSELDLDFLRKAERVTSFNISTKDFESLKHKKEIQHLINKHFFPKFDLSNTIDTIDESRLNSLIRSLKTEDAGMFQKLHNYNLKGVGPGEVTLYFLVNNVSLGGGSSAGVDVVVGSKQYEVKAVQVSREGLAYDFKLGGTVVLADILKDLSQLAASKGLGTRNEIKKTSIDELRKNFPAEFKVIETKFVERSYQYFKDHDVIFINNSKSSKQGNIEAVKRVRKEDIMIERVTSGTIKPMVKL